MDALKPLDPVRVAYRQQQETGCTTPRLLAGDNGRQLQVLKQLYSQRRVDKFCLTDWAYVGTWSYVDSLGMSKCPIPTCYTLHCQSMPAPMHLV